jgi:hypothetical protein
LPENTTSFCENGHSYNKTIFALSYKSYTLYLKSQVAKNWFYIFNKWIIIGFCCILILVGKYFSTTLNLANVFKIGQIDKRTK